MASFTKVCFYCREEFEATHSLANICSPECRGRSSGDVPRPPRPAQPRQVEAETGKRARGGVKPGEPHPRPSGAAVGCTRCGKAMRDPTGTRKYCSPACRRAMQREHRKAMIRRAYVEPVSMDVLRRRDEGSCRLCGEPVDLTSRSPHPFAATIDHVVALSRGGEHSYGNTQLAHLRCNMRKGAG